ncbi:helix-turn-helix domain-containing protein [Ferrimonas sp.]|uniref:helix-turn-helix domain-containing protein n=1 Tax=Ferrimonas sp. TaxID=2080861 RepID=UPI003A8D9F9D
MTAKQKSPRQRAWEAMLTKPSFTNPEIAKETGVEINTVRCFTYSLQKANRVECIRDGFTKRFTVVAPDDMAFGPGSRKGQKVNISRSPKRQRQKMWNAIRVKRHITIPELSALTDVHRNSAARYLRALEQSGYLRRQDNGNREAHLFRLVRYTGPRPPIQRQGIGLWDDNECKLYPFTDQGSSS